MEKHAVSRLIGAPPGYVGYDEGGVLTEAVRAGPIRSCCSTRWKRRTGRVQRAAAGARRWPPDRRQGRVVDFTNTLIILTSNLGSQYLATAEEGQDVATSSRR
jgi:ATP-dependent Clp protease ATP-binding subunit ClpB